MEETVLQKGNAAAYATTTRYFSFLHTMARFHKYSVKAQQSLHRAPETYSAVATAELWQKLGHTLKEGARGISIHTPNGGTEYVYDVSDTSAAGLPLLWQYHEEHHRGFFKTHGISTASDILDMATDLVMEDGIERLEDIDFLVASTAHIILERMGLNPEESIQTNNGVTALELRKIIARYIYTEDDLKNRLPRLLEKINRYAASVLSPLGSYIRAYEKERVKDGSNKKQQKGNLVSGTVRLDSRHSDQLSAVRQAEVLEKPRGERGSDPVSGAVPGRIQREIRSDDGGNDKAYGRDGRTAQPRPADLAPEDERRRRASNGVSPARNSIVTERSLFEEDHSIKKESPQEKAAAFSDGESETLVLAHKIVTGEVSFSEAAAEIKRNMKSKETAAASQTNPGESLGKNAAAGDDKENVLSDENPAALQSGENESINRAFSCDCLYA